MRNSDATHSVLDFRFSVNFNIDYIKIILKNEPNTPET